MAQDKYINLKGLSKLIEAIKAKFDGLGSAIGTKVDKVSGKGLSTNDYTTSEKNKLAGIATGAEVNVQSDWSVTDTSSDAYIKNKPTIPSAVTESTVSGWGFTKNTGTYSKPSTGIPKTDLASAVQSSLSKADSALQSHQTIYGLTLKASGGSTIATYTPNSSSKSVTFDKDVVGLSNVENKSSATIRGEITKDNVTSALGYTPTTENGNYPNMRVGLADDLGDIEETIESEYIFQPTANPNEIRDGYAHIDRIKGNSLVWNQLLNRLSPPTTNSYTTSINGDVLTFTTTQYLKDHSVIVYGNQKVVDPTHNYLIEFECSSNLVPYLGYIVDGKPGAGAFWMQEVDKFSIKTAIKKITSGVLSGASLNIGSSVPPGTYWVKQNIIDLTQMFGEGYEPTTVEEFYARCPQGMSTDYNEGEIINVTADAVKSVGFNQWDEEWEVGSMDADGLPLKSNDAIRSAGFSKCLPNTLYYALGNLAIFFYDLSGVFISFVYAKNDTFSTPANCGYFKIATAYNANYGNTYNHDICINLSDPDKNGTYEPYREFVKELPCNTFDGGMKSAGTAYDEVYYDANKKKYINVQRIGDVDLGILDWIGSSHEGAFYFVSTSMSNRLIGSSNGVSSKYIISKKDSVVAMEDKSILYNGLYQTIYVKDSAYTDANTFKQAMKGVKLIYELAEPIITELDTPYLDYYVTNDGTEEVLYSEPTTPIRATTTYNFDTIGTVRQNRFDIGDMKGEIKDIHTELDTKASTSIATTSANGLMSSSMVTQLNSAVSDASNAHSLAQQAVAGLSSVPSMSQTTVSSLTQSGMTFNTSYSDSKITFTKVGKMVNVQGAVDYTYGSASDGTVKICTIPSGYYPAKQFTAWQYISGNGMWRAFISSDQHILYIHSIRTASGATSDSSSRMFVINLTYVVS